jgi:hypothetical protein
MNATRLSPRIHYRIDGVDDAEYARWRWRSTSRGTATFADPLNGTIELAVERLEWVDIGHLWYVTRQDTVAAPVRRR